ncbi:MAG: acetolactate synthase small subunit [Bacteroidaceae bacterium]|nr:acetolactate synthase small subunit [Bacteroidaceae bacterium]
MEEKFYTMLIYSENFAGILNQITAVFTRRQVNIESLNVCASSTPGVHKYTITCNCTEEMVKMLTKQIEKKIDVLQANYYTDDEIFIMEACLIKVSTPMILENREASLILRTHGAHIVEVNPTYSIIEMKGMTEDILSLYQQLNALGMVLQFVRSGRIAVTKSPVEKLDKYLEEREKLRD